MLKLQRCIGKITACITTDLRPHTAWLIVEKDNYHSDIIVIDRPRSLRLHTPTAINVFSLRNLNNVAILSFLFPSPLLYSNYC